MVWGTLKSLKAMNLPTLKLKPKALQPQTPAKALRAHSFGSLPVAWKGVPATSVPGTAWLSS